MKLSDLILGRPHRVLQVKMMLVDEETGEVFARKIARIHETDLPAGKLHMESKVAEIMIDAAHLLQKELVQ